MKRFLMFMMTAVLLLGATSCNSCKREKQTNETMVEKTIKTDYDYMFATYEDFVWYESQIVTDEWFDESNTVTVASVTNVFQYIEGGQPHVVMFKHYDGKCDTTITEDFWIEDCAVKPLDITVTFNDAYKSMMKSNYPKPHSQKCAIRKSVGPYDSNVQYTFGNIESTLYVDAKTGDVSLYDPAFVPNE